MELKDVILSTLAEMEEIPSKKQEKPIEFKVRRVEKAKVEETEIREEIETPKIEEKEDDFKPKIDTELIYLNSIRERLLVLFEGFQAPNNTNIEAKIDITLNYLEYVLATTESRIELLKKGNVE